MSREFYIDYLERLKVLDGRFKNLKCINYDKKTGKKQGNFSLVFRGDDNLEDTPVAVKLFDPDASHDPYRLESFRREPEILKLLLGKNKCFQLVDSLKDFKTTIKVPIPTGGHLPFDIHFQYFVTEWIDHQIDQYFESQQDYNALEKLYLFNDIVLAVEQTAFIGYYNVIVFVRTDKIRQSIKRSHIEPAAIQLYGIDLFGFFHDSVINADLR